MKTDIMKTELEKMLSGELYQVNDERLTSMRRKVKDLITTLNNRYVSFSYESFSTIPMPSLGTMLKRLIDNMGENTDIQPPFVCDYGVHICIGKNVLIKHNCTISDSAEVTIGDNVIIGPNVALYTSSQSMIASERLEGLESASPIRIKDNVCLAGNIVVCPGVTIGENTTIGVGSVVTKDIPANVFAEGNPCVVIKMLQ
jgi:maltose O-acetyltransferase